MYLSRIEILGFKSFAQRVDIKFDTGVTAIVGPNGCGKTNIVDAIRWVLGEQRYSLLRSDRMEDLIFNGTKNRKPLSMAEVSLIIENTKGILPTDYSEITISRRVYRSGESEYLLNKAPCRLKDILDLFMDTGIGPDAYSVIELRMIETILSDKADERRRLFEEAAGVTKYKHRRKAAYRKLESVQQDLVRVNDIVKEIQKTVNSLERQARKAEQYNVVSQRLRTIEVDLLEREYAYLDGKLKTLQERLVLATADKEKVDQELQRQEDLLDQLRIAMSETEEKLIGVQREVATRLEHVHRIEEKKLVANERRSSLYDNIARWEKEKVDLDTQQEKLESDKRTLNESCAALADALTLAQEEYEGRKTELGAFEGVLAAKKIEVQQNNDEAISLIHTLAEKKGERDRLGGRIENLRGRIERAAEDNVQYAAGIKEMEERVRRMTAEDKELRRRFVEAEMELYQQEAMKKQLQEENESLRHKALALKAEIERNVARMDFLRGLIEGEEGSSEGAKFLLAREHWKRKRLVSVADLVNAEEKYRSALEAALGDMAHVLVVGQPDDAYAAVEELRKHEKGKATFIILSRIPTMKRSGRPAEGGPGAVWAADVARAKEPYRRLINFLLDGVMVAETLEQANQAVRSLAGVRCVTLDGQIVSTAGVVRGGSRRGDEGGMIGKAAQIVELEEDVQLLRQELENVKAQQTEKSKALDALDTNPLKDAVKSIEREMTAVEVKIAQVEFEKNRAQDETERNRAEIERLTYEIEQTQAQINALAVELTSLEQKKNELDERVRIAAREMESLENEWGERAKMLNESEIRFVTLQGEHRNAQRELAHAEAAISESIAARGRRSEDVQRARDETSHLTEEIESYENELAFLREDMRAIEVRKQEIEREYAERREHIHEVELKVKDDRRLHDDSVSVMHDLEVKVTGVRANIDHVKERAKNEFELELELKTYAEDEWVDFAARREEVKQLKEQIRALGAINFAAFDEFTAESERLQFLTQQRDDLLEAERTLLSTIEEINATAQKKFLDTFALIRENFIKTFQGLFDPGDECDLRLEEGVDPLEARIEITAKPRGKRPTSIDLLSGGEKTLTAIALLFAIYLVKPSPFCILDEVDAPLDDSNIDRYTRILHRFSDNTQFIVVTHNKRTMEAASALYGVTMEEEGVSKIVTVRFTEGARVGSATLASGM